MTLLVILFLSWLASTFFLAGQPGVTAATIDFEKAIAFVWVTPEAKAAKDWEKELGEKLANHLSMCGFQSHLQGECTAVSSFSPIRHS
jgi:hypothetical protein